MLDAGITEPGKESKWITLIVVKYKKTTGEVRICVKLRKFNNACMHELFLTPFIDEVLESVGGQQIYSLIDGFSSYHHIIITNEYQHKTTFAMEQGCFQHMVMPFGLKNAPTIFSRIVMVSFKDFIHIFLELKFDDWIIFGIIKDHIESIRMMLECCRRYQISLNLMKCIFCAHFGIMLDHVFFHDGILVNPAKITIIVNLPPPTIMKQLRKTLGHT